MVQDRKTGTLPLDRGPLRERRVMGRSSAAWRRRHLPFVSPSVARFVLSFTAMLAAALSMWVAASPSTHDDLKLEAVLGTRLPAWGSTIGELERRFPGLAPHRPHGCPNEGRQPDVLDVRDPPLSIAESPVRFLDFTIGPEGLEAVGFDLGRRMGVETTQWLVRHFAYRLGPPVRNYPHAALWRLPNAIVIVAGSFVMAVRPGTRTAQQTDRWMDLAESLRRNLPDESPK